MYLQGQQALGTGSGSKSKHGSAGSPKDLQRVRETPDQKAVLAAGEIYGATFELFAASNDGSAIA